MIRSDVKIELGLDKLVKGTVAYVGVFKPEVIKGYNAQNIRPLPGTNVLASAKTGQRWSSSQDANTASYFYSVWTKTPLKKYFYKLLEKKKDVLIYDVLMNNTADDESDKRAGNSMAAIMKQAYIEMSKAKRSSPLAAKRKGHGSYAIGTGQTLQAIRGVIKRSV